MRWNEAGGAASPKRVLKRLSASVSRYPVRLDRGHFSSIGGSCHEEEESLVPSGFHGHRSELADDRGGRRRRPGDAVLSGRERLDELLRHFVVF